MQEHRGVRGISFPSLSDPFRIQVGVPVFSVVCQQGTARMGGWKDTVPCTINLMIRKNEPTGGWKLVY